MRSIRIETAVNGFIACEDHSREIGMCATGGQHVFETFSSLTKWLSEQLEKPSITQIAGVPGNSARSARPKA